MSLKPAAGFYGSLAVIATPLTVPRVTSVFQASCGVPFDTVTVSCLLFQIYFSPVDTSDAAVPPY